MLLLGPRPLRRPAPDGEDDRDPAEVLDGPKVVAAHLRAIGRYVDVLCLDHYLEVLARKPGAFSGATALAHAKANMCAFENGRLVAMAMEARVR